MTDNEIIKALECCIKGETYGDCEKMACPASRKEGCYFYLRTEDDHENTIYIELIKDALDLINRQQAAIEWFREQRDSYMQDATDFSIEVDKQKAEIERLNVELQGMRGAANSYKMRYNKAIKELAERLNKEAEKVCIDREGDFVEADGEIYDTVADWCKKTSDNIVKEMVGEAHA